MEKKNIIIFGETGAGKSSVVNMICGEKVAKVSDEAIGCTFKYEKYETSKFNLFDTIGLSEGSKGTMSAKDAVKNLLSLLKSLKTGISLIVFVFAKGRITKSMEENYKLFARIICDEQVPVVGVITHCEQETVMGTWYQENINCFEKYEITFAETASGCFTRGDELHSRYASIMGELYDETKNNFTKCIDSHVLETPWVMSNWVDWVAIVLKRVFNFLGRIFNWQQLTYCYALKHFYMSLGDSEAVATEKANEAFNDITEME